MSEEELANTIAHKLNHARDYLKGALPRNGLLEHTQVHIQQEIH